MSFVTAAPEFVTAAAGDLADIGSALGAANAVAALPTTGIAAAAADEVSTQLAPMFGAYAQKYQALSAQAAAFQPRRHGIWRSGSRSGELRARGTCHSNYTQVVGSRPSAELLCEFVVESRNNSMLGARRKRRNITCGARFQRLVHVDQRAREARDAITPLVSRCRSRR